MPRSLHASESETSSRLLAGLIAALTLVAAVPAAARAQAAVELPGPVPLPAGHDSLIRVADHPEEGRLEIVMGPVRLAPDLPHLRVPVQTTTWPRDGWMKGYDWTLVDGRGDTLPDGMLHHLGVMDPGRRQLFSPIAQRLVSAGAETGAVDLPPGLGVPMAGGAPLLVVGMFANPTDEPVEEAFLHLTVRYVSEEDALLPRLSAVPNRPCGRRKRTSNRMANAVASL